jgi:hypothetical protein
MALYPTATALITLTRSQPPFFSLMVNLLAKSEGNKITGTKYQPQLIKEYNYWMLGSAALGKGIRPHIAPYAWQTERYLTVTGMKAMNHARNHTLKMWMPPKLPNNLCLFFTTI